MITYGKKKETCAFAEASAEQGRQAGNHPVKIG
jgi:hypothetical protein